MLEIRTLFSCLTILLDEAIILNKLIHLKVFIVPITSQEAVTQALANIRLESLTLPTDVLELIKKALDDGSVDTTDILNLMRAN